MSARPSLLGARLPRYEDARLIGGGGHFVADIQLPRMVEVAIVRSDLPHARIVGVTKPTPQDAEGLVDVFTAADLVDVEPVPMFADWAQPVDIFPLCRDRVRYVGAPIAAVVAQDRYLAEDAAELVQVELDPLPGVSTMEEALAPEAPLLFDSWTGNSVVHSPGIGPEADEAFANSRSVGVTVTFDRQTSMPMETRGVVASFSEGRLTVWSSTQMPHMLRTLLSYTLGLPEREIRVIAPDVGGGFGGKSQIYQEEFLIPWLALRLRRPVRWIEDRMEHMVSACHARDVRIDLEAAFHDDGRIEALRGAIFQDVGSAEIYPGSWGPAYNARGQLTGPYRILHQKIDVSGVVTNKTPGGAYRGYGFPEAVLAMERLIERIARKLDLDPNEVRRRNILHPHELPWITPSGARLDSGSHVEAFELCLETTLAAREAARSELEGAEHLRVGMGIATYVEGTAGSIYGATGHWTSQDSASIKFDPDGGVTVAVGTSTTGQGVPTFVATIAAEVLGVELDQIRVVIGDTDNTPYGLGGWGSRSAVVAGGSIQRAGEIVRDKGLRIASHMLEVAPEDLEVGGGRISVKGASNQGVSWRDVAQAAFIRTFELPADVDAGLEATATYDPPGLDHVGDERGRGRGYTTYANATHGVVVSVDVETGEIKPLRYIAVSDCGRVVNPVVVQGQTQGAVAQGLGGALLESLPYEDGQPLSSFMTYLVPSAVEIPPMDITKIESPAPETPFGVKGAGEAGIIGPAAAIAAAVDDALSEFGVEIMSIPVTPMQVLAAIRRAPAAVV